MMFMFLVNQVFMLIIVIVGGRNVVDILKTPECVHTWKNDFNRLVKPPTNQRSLYPNCSLGNDVPYVLEDLCHGQRWISMNNYSSHIAAEVTINHEYKFAYISNKKSGCTEIGHFLKKVFKTDFFTGCNESQGSCKHMGRCSALCLDESTLNDYFFFTIVRNPYDRFFSSMKQARAPPEEEQARLVLEYIKKEYHVGDQHFETQSFALFSPVSGCTKTVPFGYVGQLEEYATDIRAILDIIAARSLKPLPAGVKHYLDNLDSTSHKRATPADLKVRFDLLFRTASDELRNGISEIYAQDFACLGYPLPSSRWET